VLLDLLHALFSQEKSQQQNTVSPIKYLACKKKKKNTKAKAGPLYNAQLQQHSSIHTVGTRYQKKNSDSPSVKITSTWYFQQRESCLQDPRKHASAIRAQAELATPSAFVYAAHRHQLSSDG
jgi:hypothetical protein